MLNRPRYIAGEYLLVGVVVLLTACSAREEGSKLLLYCGAGLRPPLAEIAAEFEKREGIRVECDYAGSEVLLSRIKLSRKGDLYIPGDTHYVEMAEKEGLVHSKRTACTFIPVILVPKGNPAGVQNIEDLARPGVRVGLGDPQACAIGRISHSIFKKGKIPYQRIQKNVVFQSLTVNELGLHIKAEKLDAVIIWDAVAAQYRDVAEVVHIPPKKNISSTVSIAVLDFSKKRSLAEKFGRFVVSSEGRRIFRKHSYTVEEVTREGE